MTGKANAFNQDIGSWNVSNVEFLQGMFNFNPNFNQNLNSWDVAKVTRMDNMFANPTSGGAFNGNIASWNVGLVTKMGGMFENTPFNQNISGWIPSNVDDMYGMFKNATSFDQNIGTWDVSNVTQMGLMFENVTLSTTNYDGLLTGWAAQTLQTGVTFDGGNSQYSAGTAATARGTLTGAPNNWTVTDGGQV